MRKELILSLIVLIVVIVVLISINFSINPYAVYDSDSGKMTFNLKEGWSAMPIISGDNFGNDCEVFGKDKFIGLMWIWSPTQNKYLHIGEASESSKYQSDFNNKYFYTAYGGLWVYLTKPCKIWINDYSAIGPDNFKIASGWQLIAKKPKIAEKFDVFVNCSIVKYNRWDNSKQKWVYETSSENIDILKGDFNSADIGEVFFMKFVSDCELSLSLSDLLPQPPPLQDEGEGNVASSPPALG